MTDPTDPTDPTDGDDTSDDEGAQPPPTEANDRTAAAWRWLIGALLIVGVAWFLLERDDGDDTSSTSAADVSTQREITYRVTGSASSVDITIETPSGTSQQSSVAVPLRNKRGERGLTFTFPPGAFVYISAQNTDASGSVTCSITDDLGNTIAEVTSRGAYTIATCDGTA